MDRFFSGGTHDVLPPAPGRCEWTGAKHGADGKAPFMTNPYKGTRASTASV